MDDQNDFWPGRGARDEQQSGPQGRSQPVSGSYQEGSVESVGGGPSGSDRSDRSGDGTAPPGGRANEGPRSDAFVSSEVNDSSARRSGRVRS